MNNNNWFIESISLVKATTLPTKEEMEKLLPSSWLAGWQVVDRLLQNGIHNVRLGHRNPYPVDMNEFYNALAANPYMSQQQLTELKKTVQEAKDTTGVDVTPAGGKFDYYADLRIAGYSDKKTAKQFFENQTNVLTAGLDARVSGAEVDINLGDLLEAFVPKELAVEAKKALDKSKKELSQSGIKFQKGRFLGEEALFVIGKNGEKICQVVLINNFVIMGDILNYALLPTGDTPVHSVACQTARRNHRRPGPSILQTHGGRVVKNINLTCKCNYCKAHPECSTLKTEDFIHREKVESLLLDIFARIKGETKGQAQEAGAEIIRGQNKIKNPKEKSRVEAGDTIRTDKTTQVNLADSAGNKISIGGKTEVKINDSSTFELLVGSITAFIKKLKPRTKFNLRIPFLGNNSIRGTIFSVWTDKITMTLTVIEGEVEFSDLKGNKVMVKDNQSCICTKEQGLQNPVTLPINLKEQFKEK